jgi:hypothetical protein
LPCFALVWLVWKGRLGEDIVGEGREAAGGGVEPGADGWPPGGDKRCLAVYVCRSSGWDCRVVWLSRRFPLLPLPTLWPALGLCQSDSVTYTYPALDFGPGLNGPPVCMCPGSIQHAATGTPRTPMSWPARRLRKKK